MPASRRPSAGRSRRHLAAVPADSQPALWDPAELRRLAYLRDLALEAGQPTEALRLIEAASTAEEAVDALTVAGLMPIAEEPADGALSWFGPLLEPDCDQLGAEIAGSQFVAVLRRWMPAEMDVASALFQLIEQVEDHVRPEAMGMLRVLAAVGPAEVRPAAAEAASRMARAGRTDPPWAAGLGAPTPGQCFGYEDVAGDERSLVTTFSYGQRKHALVTLIDYGLGGRITECYACDYSARLRTEYRLAASRNPRVRYCDYDAAQARAILEDALSRPLWPAESEQAQDTQTGVELLRARVVLLPSAGRPAGAKRSAMPPNISRLKVTLRGTRPPIWRRFEVPSDISLRRLHSVIQIGFGWEDCHLHVFETPAGRYGFADPDTEVRSDASKRLSAVADWPGKRIRYVYDFGDGWEHDITVEAVQPAEPGVRYPRCTRGRRACPPEDCGGVWGYYHLLDVLADPRHDEHAERLEWLGLSTPEEFDPDSFDRDAVNGRLSRIAKILFRP